MFASNRSPLENLHCPLNVNHENHFLMNAPEVSEQQLSKHDREDGDRAIECTTEINDSRARIDRDRADLFTPYWMYLENGARHRSLSIIATPIPLFHRTKFLRARVYVRSLYTYTTSSCSGRLTQRFSISLSLRGPLKSC